ncbi:unnamed protein product [Spirodela intermedia]|uniref:Uncharacterized protein n=1 Tax=Spirodela intermedia TaxID=51605 RepID=A0A7I8IQN0_SPIIN|nr:unnamed protein product [Spirodela intermedia]CAA6660288.1 unnamed protein product [Spirodela intermedia]
MVNLFLSKPPAGGSEGDTARERILLLQSLESIIWSVVTSGGRYEPRLWLCNTISRIRYIDPRTSGSYSSGFWNLSRHPWRVLQWFDHFASTGDFGHKKGARAMSQFAFVNRDICWEELEWKGRHGQSPAVVATKPHYFHDLNVLQTVENFLEHVPEFWSSDELAESVKDGDILHIDTQFFVDQFIHLMYEENMGDIWAMIDDFVVEEQFASLCQRILILLGEHELFGFLASICKIRRTRWTSEDFGHPSSWVENVLSSNIDDMTLNDFLLVNAVINEGRQILRLLGDEEHEPESSKIEELLKSSSCYSDVSHWSLMMECRKVELFTAIRWVSLESWIIHYTLSKECKNKEHYEALFIKNGIGFRKSGDHSWIHSSGLTEGSRSNSDDEDYRRKRFRKKRKRRKHVDEETDMDELIDFDASNEDSHLGRGSWLLSTDGFLPLGTWYAFMSKDLPEHLSRDCFSSWMKWVCSKYDS